MPFYTFKCPSCDSEKEFLQGMDSPKPKCEECAECGCNRADGTCGCDGKMRSVVMNRVFKVNAKPGSKDGSWNFGMGKSK